MTDDRVAALESELAKAQAEADRWRSDYRELQALHSSVAARVMGSDYELTQAKAELAAQREQVAQWMLANGFATGHGDTIADLLQELTWQVAAIRAECERLREDAERYRWLRDQAGEDGRAMVSVLKPGCNWCDDDMGVSKEPLDSAIDAAMKDQP